MLAVDDTAETSLTEAVTIDVLANDVIGTAWIGTINTVTFSGLSSASIDVFDAPEGMQFWWFNTIPTDGGQGTITGTPFTFEFDNFTYSTSSVSDCCAYAEWTGSVRIYDGAAEILSASGSDVVLHWSLCRDYDCEDCGGSLGSFGLTSPYLSFALSNQIDSLFEGQTEVTLTDLAVYGSTVAFGLLTVNVTDSELLAPQWGTVTVNADDTITYTPNAGITAEADSFEYRITDRAGNSDVALVNVYFQEPILVSIVGFIEGAEGLPATPGQFKVTQSATTTVPTVIHYSIGGSATSGADFHSLTGTVTIPAGATTAVIDVRVKNDTLVEPVENVILTLTSISSSAAGVSIDTANDSASIDITDYFIKFDLDIDSDNNNGFNYPENSEWEELLEDHDYALGKLIYPNDTHFTPIRLRLLPGLTTANADIRIRLDFKISGESGTVKLWNTYKADPARDPSAVDAKDGGNRLFPATEYTLAELNYDPTTGGITLWLEATMVASIRRTYQDILTYGKPDDRVKATLIMHEDTLPDSEEVKYMVVTVDSFYHDLQNREELRNAMASDIVYRLEDGMNWALELLAPDDLKDLGVHPAIVALIGQPAAVPGFKCAVYKDYVSGKFVVAFVGTDDFSDILEDAFQGLGMYSAQYNTAMEIADGLSSVVGLDADIVFTGHSLGGGLASAASVVTGLHADTFNAAGLNVDTITNVAGLYPNALANYANAAALVTARYLDWDILSFVQDNSGGLIPAAIGTRIEMDGPVDLEMAMYIAALPITTGPLWLVSLGGAATCMALAHTTPYYFYGLMVNEYTGRDIYGVDL